MQSPNRVAAHTTTQPTLIPPQVTGPLVRFSRLASFVIRCLSNFPPGSNRTKLTQAGLSLARKPVRFM